MRKFPILNITIVFCGSHLPKNLTQSRISRKEVANEFSLCIKHAFAGLRAA